MAAEADQFRVWARFMSEMLHKLANAKFTRVHVTRLLLSTLNASVSMQNKLVNKNTRLHAFKLENQ